LEPSEPAVKKELDDSHLATVREALRRSDYGELEGLRDDRLRDLVEPLVSDYQHASDWTTRDAIVFLLQDLDDERLAPIMRHALSSSTVDTRAIAICALRGDRKLFDTFLVNGFVDPSRVDAAIKQFQETVP
jgi:HEAT repeat protein